MKLFKFNKAWIIAISTFVLAAVAVAQFVAGPRRGAPMVIPSGGWIKDSHHVNTNVASPMPFRLSGNAPLYLYLDWGATNATDGVSNMNFNFQFSIDGTKWFGPAVGTWTEVDFTLDDVLGPGGGSQFITNLWDDTALTAYNFVRLHSISNSTGELGIDTNTWYITNMYFIQGNL